MATIKKWLKTKLGLDTIIPKTLVEAVYDKDGNNLNQILKGKYTADTVADEYNSEYTYNIGDYTIYNNKLYKCITDIEYCEEFTSDHWELTTCENEIVQVINSKQDTLTGAATTIASSNLTASRALISNSNGKVSSSSTTSAELGYVHGVKSAIQTQLNNKLNLSGGTLTGALNTRDLAIAKDHRLILYDTNNSFGYIKQYGSQQLVIRASSEDNYGLWYGVRENLWNLAPDRGNITSIHLGSPSYKWGNIYATNGTIQTSDRNAKDNIHYLEDDDIFIQFFMKLLPCSFTYKNTNENSNHDRTHIGFIAQDVESAMSELGLTSLDFAGFCKDQKVSSKVVKETIFDSETGEKKEVERIIEEKMEGEYIYSLRYQEFIALITKVLQKSCKRLDDLECRLSKLESKLENE